MKIEKIVFEKKGNFNYIKQDYADLVIILRLKPHKVFRRKNHQGKRI